MTPTRGQISADGETWVDTPGSVTMPFTGTPGLGLMAIGPEQSAGPIDVTFDYIRLVEEDENTAPEIGSATAAPAEGEAPLAVDFDVEATDADDDELTYAWDFGVDGTDADTSDEEDPSFTYDEPGEYTATVTVSDGTAEVSESVTVTVTDAGEPGAPAVQAFADPASGTAPLEVSFSANAIDPDGGDIEEYAWTFPGGGTAYGQTVTTTLTEPGTHEVTVTATDDQGESGTATVEVVVTAPTDQPPVLLEAEADRTSGAAPLKVFFHAVASDPERKALTYRWDYGDGGQAFGDEVEHTYREPGDYTATLTVTDQAGNVVTETFAIEVADAPGNAAPTVKAAALPASGQAPLEVLLTAQGTDPDGDALTYAWSFGDGATGKGRRVRHTYTTTGTFTATVTATDEAGNTDSATVQVVVGNPPQNQAPTVVAAADPGTAGTAPATFTFTAAGSDPEGGALSYVWEFGDGGMAGGTKATHTYTAPGTYTAKVTVTDASGLKGSATVAVTVGGQPALAGAPPAPGTAATSLLAVTNPTVAVFARKGIRVTLACGALEGKAVARLAVKGRSARALGRRALGTRALRCAGGGEATARVRPSKAVRRAIRQVAPRTLTVGLRIALPDGTTLRETLVLRRS